MSRGQRFRLRSSLGSSQEERLYSSRSRYGIEVCPRENSTDELDLKIEKSTPLKKSELVLLNT